MKTIWYWPNGLYVTCEGDRKFVMDAHKYPEPNWIEVPEVTSTKTLRRIVNRAIVEDLGDTIQGDEITNIFMDENVVVRDVDFGDEPPDRGYINDDDDDDDDD